MADVKIKDFINFTLSAVLAATAQSVVFVPLEIPQYCYINNLSGTNTGANSLNAVCGFIDDGGVYVPISIVAIAQNAAANTIIDKYIRPEFGAYIAITASSYPVTGSLMVDGYLFDIE